MSKSDEEVDKLILNEDIDFLLKQVKEDPISGYVKLQGGVLLQSNIPINIIDSVIDIKIDHLATTMKAVLKRYWEINKND